MTNLMVFIAIRLAARAMIRGGNRRKVALEDQDQFPCQASLIARRSSTKHRSTGQNEVQSTMGRLASMFQADFVALPSPARRPGLVITRFAFRTAGLTIERRCNLDGMEGD